ncbi:UDP-3-O-(3-hydroxymyristoyl)glucosamine N-acyltransferase [Octadecabacter sp.]|nr:UDP-3-O-(3-hydroxymyristoyl)glucosamine N-acyltransferase [Octadecabacter sp.]
MPLTLKDIAASLGAETLGDARLSVDRLAEPARARAGDLALAIAPKYAADLKFSKARAAVIWPGAEISDLGLDGAIIAPRGRLVMANLTQILDDGTSSEGAAGIHPTAIVHPTADIGAGADIGPFVVIAAHVRIGAGARIASHVSIGQGTTIGTDATLYAGAKIGARVQIGNGFIGHCGAVIGDDGFSFATAGPSNDERARRARPGTCLEPMDGTWHRIHSLGGVEVGHNVEIGTNATIDAGTIHATRVGNGVKIDNLVMVGHNCIIGDDCLLCGHTGLAGSVTLGARCILGGKTGIADNLTLGRDVVSGGGTIILSDVPDGTFVSGHPAQPTHLHRAGLRALRRLIPR